MDESKRMSCLDAIECLDALTDDDQDAAHEDADGILLDVLLTLGADDVVAAYVRARERVRFLYA